MTTVDMLIDSYSFYPLSAMLSQHFRSRVKCVFHAAVLRSEAYDRPVVIALLAYGRPFSVISSDTGTRSEGELD